MTTNYREILRLESLGLNKTDIASATQCARNTVSTTLARAKAEALHRYCTGLSLTQAILRHFLHIKKSSQAIILTGFSGSGNVIRTHDTSGMKNQNWK